MNDSPPDPSADFSPTATWSRLRLRAELLKRLRSFFDIRDFLEVETPILSSEVVVERHIDPLRVPPQSRTTSTSEADSETSSRPVGWLQSSPEAHMKRLLCSGAPAIYQIFKSFRAGERGPLHNPEFTLVEWYRPGDSMHDGMQLLSDLAEELLDRERAERITYREAFVRCADMDPFATEMTSSVLADIAEKNGLALPVGLGEERDAWLDLIRSRLIEPKLGRGRPTIVYDWPASQAALAQVRSGEVGGRRSEVGEEESSVAERFELYVDGIELANGYHELRDPAELRRRQQEAAAERERDGHVELPLPSRLLAAMEQGLPACSGVALGFDRLVMLATGAESIDEVLTFPMDRA